MRIFISYGREANSQFADRVYRLLQEQQEFCEVYIESRDPHLENWVKRVEATLKETDLFLLLVSGPLGHGQTVEAEKFYEICQTRKKKFEDHAVVGLMISDQTNYPEVPLHYVSCLRKEILGLGYSDAVAFVTAVLETQKIVPKFGHAFPAYKWQSYEKYIIDSALKYPGSPGYICWPQVENKSGALEGYANFLKKEVIGSIRLDTAKILVDARTQYHTLGCNPGDPNSLCLARHQLTFAEAGPRENLHYPINWKDNLGILKVAIVVTGGIAPGINAVISGIIQRHLLYFDPRPDQVQENKQVPKYQLYIIGYKNGFAPGAGQTLLFASHGTNPVSVSSAHADARRTADHPGSRLGTSRQEKMLGSSDPEERAKAISQIVTRLNQDDINILYVIGGDGSMRAAHAIWETSQRTENPISVVAVPKTMDNDILWVWQSFGFL
jgi:hypothetical protein